MNSTFAELLKTLISEIFIYVSSLNSISTKLECLSLLGFICLDCERNISIVFIGVKCHMIDLAFPPEVIMSYMCNINFFSQISLPRTNVKADPGVWMVTIRTSVNAWLDTLEGISSPRMNAHQTHVRMVKPTPTTVSACLGTPESTVKLK